MAILGTKLRITLRYVLLGQMCQTAQVYFPGGAAFATANADGVGEAWWNHVKDDWRAMFEADTSRAAFNSVLVEELDAGLAYGEYAVPVGEREGTRPATAAPGWLPSYVALGCRLTVGTRLTRPGQKRFPGFTEADLVDNEVQAAFLALGADLAVRYSSTIALGAPVATGVLIPIILSLDPVTGAEIARQDVVGFALNPMVTTQVSRRFGHGS